MEEPNTSSANSSFTSSARQVLSETKRSLQSARASISPKRKSSSTSGARQVVTETKESLQSAHTSISPKRNSIVIKNSSNKSMNISPSIVPNLNQLNTKQPSIQSIKSSLKSSPTNIKKDVPLIAKNVFSAPRNSNNLLMESDKSSKRSFIKLDMSDLEPQGKRISDHMKELNDTVKKLSQSVENDSTAAGSNLEKIAIMSNVLTNEANALRQSIRTLSEDIARTKLDLGLGKEENEIEFPYHLFLMEIVINKIKMKCECFEADKNNLVITASFLGKPPISLYDSTISNLEDFNKLNVGKSILFAMTYDRICNLKEFEILLELSRQPPCTHFVTKIGETRMDYTNDFIALRKEMCQKWTEEQPKDKILCTASTPLLQNTYYILCAETENPEAIGIIEVSLRMSFLGKEITTVFSTSPKPFLKENNGITMCSCQKVEMDDSGKILLDEDIISKKHELCQRHTYPTSRSESPMSQFSSISRHLSTKRYVDHKMYLNQKQDSIGKYDEICTKMNDNELKIRVPKSTKVERVSKYEKISELCSCESTPYNTGEQIQFEMPPDKCYPGKTHNTFTSNLKYTYKPCDRSCETKDKRIINVTPTNCPVPVNMEKRIHPLKDVFVLKIGKKLETKDKKTDLEIELVTPKAPNDPAIVNNDIAQQCSTNEIAKKRSKTKQRKNLKNKSKTNLKRKGKSMMTKKSKTKK